MLTSRLGSTRPSIALGWELDVVTIVVLGGVNIQGGSGTMPGVVIAAFVMGLVTYGLGLLNVPGIIMSIVIGLMLIGIIALPRSWSGGPARGGGPHERRSAPSILRRHEKHAFAMRLQPGLQADDYRRRHDAIWPELVRPCCARPASRIIPSISIPPPTCSSPCCGGGATTPWRRCPTTR